MPSSCVVLAAGLLVGASAPLAALQVQAPPPPPADTARPRPDSGPPRRPPRSHIPLTPELEASAFTTPGAKALLLLARDARMRQDSSIVAYDAMAYNRLSAGLGMRSIGRERLALRSETAMRVRWQRGGGATIDYTGARAAVPMAAVWTSSQPDMELDLPTLPYYPGRDALWFGGPVAFAEVNPDEVIHPLAIGAEAYYRYALGDSLRLDIGGGRRILLRELRISARVPDWRRIVGTFWFDVASGILVRAAYRLSTEINIIAAAKEEDEAAMDDVPLWVRPFLSPLRATLEGVTIEYGLFNGVWMPRTQSLTGLLQVNVMRLPVTFEERYKYASINVKDPTLEPLDTAAVRRGASDALVSVRVGAIGPADADEAGDAAGVADDTPPVRSPLATGLEGLPADSLRARLALVGSPDSLERAAREARTRGDTLLARRLRRQHVDVRRDSATIDRKLQCVTTGSYTTYSALYGDRVPVRLRTPCDRALLARSPDLPPSLFSPGEALFGVAEREELLAELSFGLQAGFAPRRPVLEFSLAEGALRYNRVEGLSTGIGVSQELGGGWRWRGDARFGLADRQPLASVSVQRMTGRRSVTARLYRETAVATDYGQPLSFGASFVALLQGLDDGMYYRAAGADLTWRTEPAGATSARLFVERHADAPVATRWTVFGGSNDRTFTGNVAARRGSWVGTDLRDRRTFGVDPDDWRLFTDLRLEGAVGTSAFARLLAEGTVTRTIVGQLSGAITGAAGTTAGTPPPQRQFFIGGLSTVRGQFVSPTAPGFAGTAFWFARNELAWGRSAARLSAFYDVGWAGDRVAIGVPGARPVRGAGLGVTFLDGLMRVDVVRGLAPTRQTRVVASVDVRF